jgi:proteasome lid subunit RPN8/RPN11
MAPLSTPDTAPARREKKSSSRVEVRGLSRTMVCTKTTIVTNEHGQQERLKAGVTFIHDPRHWLVQTYPHLFAAAGPTRTRAKAAPRGRTAARAPRPTRPEWKPLVRLDTSAAPTFTAHITDKAYLAITDQAFGHRGEIETGGALFGIPAAKDAPLKIRRAGLPGPKARASESSMHVDCEHVRREALEAERDGRLDRWIGSWHTHPSADGLPSDNDLRFFAWDLRELHHMGRGQGDYIALIVTPKWESDYARGCRLSWVKPTLNAWRMYAVAEDQFICTRAEVVRC